MPKINYNSEDMVNHHGIGAIIKNEKGQILMQDHVKYGFWTLPVGKVKPYQSIFGGLKEEIFEECNLSIEEVKKILTKDYFYVRNDTM